LRPDLLDLVLSYLPLVWLAQSSVLAKPLHEVVCAHSHWRLFVLQGFGAYYDDYVTNLRDARDWRRLLIYIRRVHHNVDKSLRKVRTFPQALRPTVRYGRMRRNGRKYRGSMELADNCSCAIWENGQHVQIMRIRDGRILVDIDTGLTCPRYFHRIASCMQKLFVCVSSCIKVWDLTDLDAEPTILPPPILTPGKASTWEDLQALKGRPLELLVHKKRLVLFESNGLYLWHTDTLQPVASVTHSDRNVPDNSHHLEVQWMGQWFATWQRGLSTFLNIWTLDGELEAVLRNDHPVIQLDVVRITWQDVRELGHFLLAALDEASLIRIWDSAGFQQLCSFDAGCMKPFDLIITQDFLATVNDNVQDNRLEIEFWNLWLADREAAGSEAAKGDGDSAVRPRFEMKKKLSLVDVDSYFASYRNYFNVCSYHKNGHESVQVYRSNSLKKKIHFTPAKHTKFEEWIAIQVEADGSVNVYDFRPDGVAFDDIPANVSPASPVLGSLVAAQSLRSSETHYLSGGRALTAPSRPPRWEEAPRLAPPDNKVRLDTDTGSVMEWAIEPRPAKDEPRSPREDSRVEELNERCAWLEQKLRAAEEELARLRQ
jgi:hypothetical protein